jgi:hypothetical protein
MAWRTPSAMPSDLRAAIDTLAAYASGTGGRQAGSSQLALEDVPWHLPVGMAAAPLPIGRGRSRSRSRRRRSCSRSRSMHRERRDMAEVRARLAELEALAAVAKQQVGTLAASSSSTTGARAKPSSAPHALAISGLRMGPPSRTRRWRSRAKEKACRSLDDAQISWASAEAAANRSGTIQAEGEVSSDPATVPETESQRRGSESGETPAGNGAG